MIDHRFKKKPITQKHEFGNSITANFLTESIAMRRNDSRKPTEVTRIFRGETI